MSSGLDSGRFRYNVTEGSPVLLLKATPPSQPKLAPPEEFGGGRGGLGGANLRQPLCDTLGHEVLPERHSAEEA